MGRSILAVITGYVTMFILVLLSFTCAYLAMGADGAFKPGSWEVSGLWVVASFVLGLIAAVAGGYVCAAIAKSPGAIKGLVGLVLVLGFVQARMVAMAPKPELPERTADIPNMEAMQKAQTPLWIALLNPVVGAGGALLGARLRKKD